MSLLNQLEKHKFKILCLILLLMFSALFYLHFKTRKRMSQQNHAISDFANHLLSYTDSLERQNSVLENAFTSLDNDLKAKICHSIVDDDTDPNEIAKGYDCLAQIELLNKDIASIYRAIRYESLSLEASYNDKYQRRLLSMITGTDSTVLTTNFDEYSFLTDLSKSDHPDISGRALYRMSLINSIGRTSSLKAYNHNLEKAADLRAQVLQKVNFPKRKSIDLLFSLNNNSKYIGYAKTAFTSILLNADLDSDYNFYIIMDSQEPISAENMAKLDSLHHLSSYKIKFITSPANMLDHKKANFSDARVRILFQKLLVEDLLSNLDRIITLDVDLIVLRDLYRLQTYENLDNKVFAAAIENIDLHRKELCGFNYMSTNTGVNIQNLKLMREIKNSSYLINEYQNIFTTKDKGCLRLIDQDVLNIAYKDRIKFISKRWNYLPVFDYNTKFMSYIIHFGGTKASEENKSPENLLYMKYSKFANSGE